MTLLRGFLTTHRIRRVVCAVMITVSVTALAAMTCGPSSAGGASASPQTPPNKLVDIYTMFGQGLFKNKADGTVDTALPDAITALKKYGYDVHIDDYVANPASTTYAQFAKMAAEHPGIFMFLTHGSEEEFTPRQKVLRFLHLNPGRPFPASITVEWFKSDADQEKAFTVTYKNEFKNHWISPVRAQVPNGGEAPALAVTELGLHKLFGRAPIGIVVGLACESNGVGYGFNASSYFGYQGCVGPTQVSSDLTSLMESLKGTKGFAQRATTEADAGSLDLLPGAKPVVLAPAVESVTPGDQTTLKPGTTHVSVNFDSKIKGVDAASVASISGCKTTITKGSARWSNDNQTLSLDVDLPKNAPKGQATLTVSPAAALGGGGADIELDGNENGTGKHGVYPNRDADDTKFNCQAGTRPITFTGDADGFQLRGPIQAANSSVRCTALSGDVTGVFINGFLKDGTQVGLEIDASSGTFGPGGSANGTMTLDLYPARKLDHAGGAGGGPFGTGSGSVTINGTSGGSIDATLDDGVTVSGSWTCNS